MRIFYDSHYFFCHGCGLLLSFSAASDQVCAFWLFLFFLLQPKQMDPEQATRCRLWKELLPSLEEERCHSHFCLCNICCLKIPHIIPTGLYWFSANSIFSLPWYSCTTSQEKGRRMCSSWSGRDASAREGGQVIKVFHILILRLMNFFWLCLCFCILYSL